MTTEEKLDRLTNIVDALASSAVSHDNQIDTLLKIVEKHHVEILSLSRQWQAYLNTLPRN